ncbi:MAG: DEAD/DEAH box helicase [Deltaproteobacteria bacterium]|nr:DEAD/DEAH box helicase [Deltaproteobacteria bacterium]
MRSPDYRAGDWPRTVIQRWSERRTTGEIVANMTSVPGEGETAPFPKWLLPQTENALRQAGIDAAFSHQVAAWEGLVQDRNVVVATPTASGKTLCYNVPIINRLLKDSESRALYVFPTKALSRDQEVAIRSLAARAGVEAGIYVYDGDTPADERRLARRDARILITNPDMLHMGILPHHARWSAFFAGLSTVVIDELHAYRGVFGSHVANVIRRLVRVAGFYGANPGFAACSATIANPRELAEAMVGMPFELVEKSGAPTGPKTFAVYNPEVVDSERGIRRSALKEASGLAGNLVAAKLTTLVFCQSRRGVEIVLRYLRDRVASSGRDPERVRGYRGGYLPTVRREIETSLQKGELDAVVATNALELGIDIGSLDAVVMAGYPGTIAALRQRAGRAGRRQGPSLAVLVATSNPLDQFLAREPKYLTETSPERALIQPDNVDILLAHLGCAAFELPFDANGKFGGLSVADTEAVLSHLAEQGVVSFSRDRFYYVGDSYPAGEVSLRNVAAGRVVVIDQKKGEPIAEVDRRAARIEVHEDAIYLSEGRTFFVENLDLDEGVAQVNEVEPVYYTTAHCEVDVRIVEELGQRSLTGGEVANGEVCVTESVIGFKKVRFNTHENLGYGQVSLPSEEMETEATWLTISSSLENLLKEYKGSRLMRGLDGLGYAVHQIASLRLMCDPHDLAFVVQGGMGGVAPSLFFYDTHVGGVGLSERAFEDIEPILQDARRLVDGCSCVQGCPSCVGPFEEAAADVKTVAVALVRGLVGLREVV